MWLRIARKEVCRELCEKRIYYEEMILEKPTTSLERCIKICITRSH